MVVNDVQIKCLTFDLDDTLWLCAPVIHNAEFVFYTWLGEEFPAVANAYDLDGLTYQRREVFLTYPEMAHDFSWLRRRWLANLAAEFDLDDRLVEDGFRVYHAARNDVSLFPGATDILQRVSSEFRCGSITNGNADVAMVGIGQYFDFSITAADAGASKPSPVIFNTAVAAAGVDPAEILHIGDDPNRDVRGAAAAGMRTAWINPQGEPWQGEDSPDFELRIITELPALLDANREH